MSPAINRHTLATISIMLSVLLAVGSQLSLTLLLYRLAHCFPLLDFTPTFNIIPAVGLAAASFAAWMGYWVWSERGKDRGTFILGLVLLGLALLGTAILLHFVWGPALEWHPDRPAPQRDCTLSTAAVVGYTALLFAPLAVPGVAHLLGLRSSRHKAKPLRAGDGIHP